MKGSWLRILLSSLFLVGTVACSEASFTGSGAQRGTRTSSSNDPNDPNGPGGNGGNPNDPNGPGGNGGNPNDRPDTPQTNPENPPVDPTGGEPNGPQPGGPDDKDQVTFHLNCEDGQNTVETIDFEAPATTEVTAHVEGEFCPTATNELTVVFVVDYSGSMGRHFDQYTGEELKGNDPQINGSCGRLRAAKQVYDKLKADRSSRDKIRVAMVPFASGIVSTHSVGITDLDQFGAKLTKDVFCQYVPQTDDYGYDPVNPGAIKSALVNSSTNYRAAFSSTESMLKGLSGRKEVYFVSDGEPTSGGNDPVEAGRAAGYALRQNVDNLSVNGLLLGDVDKAAESVLEMVTGSKERVRYAADANQLATEILKFPDASIRSGSANAIIEVAPHGTKDLGLMSMAKDSQRDMIWVYRTQPFLLAGTQGAVVDNVVTVTALGSDGSTHSQTVRIRYRQK